MSMVSMLKSKEKDFRLTSGKAWLVWDVHEWVVYSRGYMQKKTRELCRVDDLEMALKTLWEAS